MVLAMCLRDHDDPKATFDRQRRPRVSAIARHARRNGSGKAVEPGLGLWFRDLLMPLFLRLGSKAQTRSHAFTIDRESRTAGAA